MFKNIIILLLLLSSILIESIGFGLLGATVINLLYVPVAYSIKFKKNKKAI